MTWPASATEASLGLVAPESVPWTGDLLMRPGGDGSFSLWSTAFQEGFHSGRGALREARETFLAPSQLERFQPGERLRVVEVCVGTATNLALLLEACVARGIVLEWWGLELDPRPMALALASVAFRRPWHPATLRVLEQVLERGEWHSERASGRLLWGDARHTLVELLRQRRGQVDLVWHDAFSPRRCPQLWTVEVLAASTQLLAPTGRWISFSSAAAVRDTLRQLDLRLMALEIPATAARPTQAARPAQSQRKKPWSGGTVASPAPLGQSSLWRELSAMERDHLISTAGEPYRDPGANGDAASIVSSRLAAQAAALASGTRCSSSAWRRRWGVDDPLTPQ